MGADQNTVQRAVVFAVAVMRTLLNGTFDTLVCLAVHVWFLLFFDSGIVLPEKQENKQEKHSIVAFVEFPWYDKKNKTKGE